MLSKGFIKTAGVDTNTRVVANHSSQNRLVQTAQNTPARSGAIVNAPNRIGGNSGIYMMSTGSFANSIPK